MVHNDLCLCDCVLVCIALSSCDVFPIGYKLQSDGDIFTVCSRKLLVQHSVSDFAVKQKTEGQSRQFEESSL